MLYQKIHSGPTNGCIGDKMAFYLVHEVRRCNNYDIDSPSSKSCSYFDVLEKTYFKKSRWQEIKRSWFLSISSHFQIHCQLRRDISPWGSKGYNGWIKRNRDLETFVFPRLTRTFNTYDHRVRKKQNFPDSKIFVVKTFWIKRAVNCINFQIHDKYM